MGGAQQAQRVGLAVHRAEGRADHGVTDAGHHGAHLLAADDAGADVAAFVVHAVDHRGAVFQFLVTEAEMQAAGLLQRHVHAGGGLQRRSEAGPELRGLLGPTSIAGQGGAFALHPDQAEIAARGSVGDVALIEQRHLGALLRGTPGDGAADKSAADDNQVVGVAHLVRAR